MWIGEEGGVNQCGQGFLYVLGLSKGSFGLFKAYLVLFGLFLPKTEEKKEKKKTYIK